MDLFQLIPTKRLSLWLVAIILFFIVFGVYLNSINSPFYYDDYFLIKENHKLAEADDLKYLFHPKQYYVISKESTYRPVTSAVYFFFKNVLHDNPSYCRIFNILLHLGNCFLLLLLFRQLKFDEWFCLLAVGLFAVHPLNTELINVISFNEDMIGAFFCLLALYGYLREHWGWYIISLFAFLLSCFAKETFVVLPALLFIIDLYQRESELKQTRRLIVLLSYVIAAALFLYINLFLMKNTLSRISADYPGGSMFSALLTFSVVLVYYLRLFFIPVGLTPVYSFPVYSRVAEWPVIASLIILSLVVSLIIFGYKHRKPYYIYLIWFFLFLLPTSNIIPFWTYIAERYLYMSLMGLIPALLLLAGWGLDRLGYDERKTLTFFGVILLVSLAFMTIRRNIVYQDPVALWLDVIKQVKKRTPDMKHGTNLALAYYRKGEYGKAIEEYELVIKDYPDYPQAYYDIGNCYLALGVYQNALENFKMSLERKVRFKSQLDYYRTLANAGIASLNLADYPAALQYLVEAVKIRPDYPNTYYNLALVYEKMGRNTDAKEAREQYKKLLK